MIARTTLRRLGGSTCLALLLTWTHGGDQAAAGEQPATAAPVAEPTAEPTTGPAVDPAHALDWNLGTWRGERVDGADGERSPMEMRVESILDGAGQVRHLRVGDGDDPYLGYAVQVYDPAAGLWVRQYVNAVRRRFATLEGAVVSGEKSVWRPAETNPARLSRLDSVRFYRQPPDPEQRTGEGWRRTMHVSTDGGETWRVLWRDELWRDEPWRDDQRRAAPPPAP